MFPKAMVMGIAIHEAGGARMGADPATSILNEWNRSWDVPNLYVTDASAFPSSGVSGTSLTIMAMTVRACRHLANELRTSIV
jgi:choline dehydrogenase-like flavoprotein